MKNSKTSRFLFVGGHPSLDFLNTEIVDDGKPKDLLGDYGDVVDWLTDAGTLDPRSRRDLQKKWTKAERDRLLARVKDFRSLLRKTVKRLADSAALPQEALTEINKILEHGTRYLR